MMPATMNTSAMTAAMIAVAVRPEEPDPVGELTASSS
jgi:hypothetical protein